MNQEEVVMKKNYFTIYFSALALMLMIINIAPAQTSEHNVNWDLIGENLVVGIQSGNPGVQQAAMRLIIQYADKLNVNDAERELMRIYRFSDDTNMRRLALVTLHKIESEYAIDFAKRNLKFETNEKVLKLSEAAICDCIRKNTFASDNVAKSDELVAAR
jgi:hypothetical protein